MIDEVYLKSALVYLRGTLFGKSVHRPENLAETMLACMVKFLYSRPELIAKILPVYRLDVNFQLSQYRPILYTTMKQLSGEVVAIIADGNRVNQSFLKKMEIVEGKSWIMKDGTFLLYNYVHVFKCIRNNCITGKCGELRYNVDGVIQIV